MAARLSALCASRFLPPGGFLVLTSVRGWVDPRAIVRLEGLGKLKEIHLIRDSNRRPSSVWHSTSTNYATACPIFLIWDIYMCVSTYICLSIYLWFIYCCHSLRLHCAKPCSEQWKMNWKGCQKGSKYVLTGGTILAFACRHCGKNMRASLRAAVALTQDWVTPRIQVRNITAWTNLLAAYLRCQ
jgi:hypothetical protein